MVRAAVGRLVRPPDEGELTDPSLATIFQILRNERRRFTIHYLKQVDEPVPVPELVEQIAAWENDTQPETLTQEQRQRVHVSMLQSHLPAMVGADLVVFDREEGQVEITDGARDLDIYLEIVPEGDIDWGEYYLGISLFNAVVVALVWMDLYPFGALPEGVWIVFVPAVFLISALLHHWYQQKHQLGSGPAPDS